MTFLKFIFYPFKFPLYDLFPINSSRRSRQHIKNHSNHSFFEFSKFIIFQFSVRRAHPHSIVTFWTLCAFLRHLYFLSLQFVLWKNLIMQNRIFRDFKRRIVMCLKVEWVSCWSHKVMPWFGWKHTNENCKFWDMSLEEQGPEIYNINNLRRFQTTKIFIYFLFFPRKKAFYCFQSHKKRFSIFLRFSPLKTSRVKSA